MERHEDTAAPGSFVECWEHFMLPTVWDKLLFPTVHFTPFIHLIQLFIILSFSRIPSCQLLSFDADFVEKVGYFLSFHSASLIYHGEDILVCWLLCISCSMLKGFAPYPPYGIPSQCDQFPVLTRTWAHLEDFCPFSFFPPILACSQIFGQVSRRMDSHFRKELAWMFWASQYWATSYSQHVDVDLEAFWKNKL